MAPKKNTNDQASDIKRQAEWDRLIANGLEAVDQQNGYDKMQTLYEKWSSAQAAELGIWGDSSKKSVWKCPKKKQSEYQEKLGDTGKGYIPVSQFKDWEDTFENNEDLRKAMLETFIPTYIVPTKKNDDKGKSLCSEKELEKEIWTEYHRQAQRVLIISREAALYNNIMKRGGHDGIPYWAIWEAYSYGALTDNDSIKSLIESFVVEDDFKKEYPLGSSPSLRNAWLRKVSRANRPEIDEAEKRSTGEKAARQVLLTSYLVETKNPEDPKEKENRALNLLKEIFPKTLNNASEATAYDDAYKVLFDNNVSNVEQSPDREKWIESLYGKVAYMTVNKRGGSSKQGGSRGSDVVNGYLERYGEFLLKEISLYAPTTIVIYGPEIYEWLKDNKNDLTLVDKVEAIGLPHWAGRVYLDKEKGKIPTGSYRYWINEHIHPVHHFEIPPKEENAG